MPARRGDVYTGVEEPFLARPNSSEMTPKFVHVVTCLVARIDMSTRVLLDRKINAPPSSTSIANAFLPNVSRRYLAIALAACAVHTALASTQRLPRGPYKQMTHIRPTRLLIKTKREHD